MSTIQLSLPSDYGYVLLTASLTTLVAQFHTLHTSKHRRRAQVPYPNAYATPAEAKESRDKYLFNCAQRAHANFLEHIPQFYTTLLISGLRFPRFSAAMGLVWLAGRVVYTLGYTDPAQEKGAGRTRGAFFYVGALGLLGGSVWTGLEMAGLLGERAVAMLR
ncbi:MAG: hypothetical protein LQ344_002889 [Seirophora lacunosa]|nr:MAG: hypothetical protein LQ344_002889 [Seirophora lacunosa]